MKKAIIIVAVIVVVGAGVAFVLAGSKGSNKQNSQTGSSTSSGTTQSNKSSDSSSAATPASSGGAEAVAITANDSSASPDTINVKKGDNVTITFNVSGQGTYHGGLDFKNDALGLDSGPIAEGSSGKVSFMADKSFKFTPFWYKSSVQKDYFVTVNVQ